MGDVGGRTEFGGVCEVVAPGCPVQLIAVATNGSVSTWELVTGKRVTELDGVYVVVHALVRMASAQERWSTRSLKEGGFV
jgi:hypothetical protein